MAIRVNTGQKENIGNVEGTSGSYAIVWKESYIICTTVKWGNYVQFQDA